MHGSWTVPRPRTSWTKHVAGAGVGFLPKLASQGCGAGAATLLVHVIVDGKRSSRRAHIARGSARSRAIATGQAPKQGQYRRRKRAGVRDGGGFIQAPRARGARRFATWGSPGALGVQPTASPEPVNPADSAYQSTLHGQRRAMTTAPA